MNHKYSKRSKALKAGFRSGLELGIAGDLDAKKIEYQYEPRKFNYTKADSRGVCTKCGTNGTRRKATYLPDFYLVKSRRYVESKGRLTSADRTKLKSVRDTCEELRDLHLLLAANNWCTKAHKQRYSDWAKANGFKYHVGKLIPKEWF